MVYSNPSKPCPAGVFVFNSFGAPAFYAAVIKNGLITACGQTYEHWLH